MNEDNKELSSGGCCDESDFWAQLKGAREAQGLSVGDVSAHLKLTIRQIEAIERGELSSLPGSAFARGFVRNYARFLGLDPAVFMSAIDASEKESPEIPAVRMSAESLGDMPHGRRKRLPFMPIFFIVLAILALLSSGAYYGWFESRDEDLLARLLPTEAEFEPVAQPVPADSAPAAESSATLQSMAASDETSSAPVATESSVPGVVVQSVSSSVQSPVAAGSAPAVPQSGAVSLVLEFEGDSWVDVRGAGGKVLMSRLNPKGSSQTVQGTPPLSLVIGNASKVKLKWRGKPVDLAPHAKVDVARLSLQ